MEFSPHKLFKRAPWLFHFIKGQGLVNGAKTSSGKAFT